MKFYIDGDGLYHLKMSERNAKALLSKLSHPWSMKSIECRDIYLDGRQVPVGSLTLVVTIEDDATHYADRMAGEMHPVTESDLKSWEVT